MAQQLVDEHGDEVEAAGAPRWLAVRRGSSGDMEAWEIDPGGWLGHDLPGEWQAAAVVATGRVHSLDATAEIPAAFASAVGGGLLLACVVSRSGGVGWWARFPDGSESANAPAEGLILDTLRRAAGHSTPPPDAPAAELLTILWAATGFAVGQMAGGRLAWGQLAHLHPVLPLDPYLDPDEAEALLIEVSGIVTWESFRRVAGCDRLPGILPGAELAEWMDEGLFSRWVLAGQPTMESATGDLKQVVTADAYHRFRRVAATTIGLGRAAVR